MSHRSSEAAELRGTSNIMTIKIYENVALVRGFNSTDATSIERPGQEKQYSGSESR